MKVVTDKWPEEGDVGISEVSITYVQDGDCTEDRDSVQEMTISTRNNGIDNFLHFKTTGWSIDYYESLIEIFKDFYKRTNYTEVNSDDSFEEIIYSLLELHRRLPSLRFGQLLCNVGITMDMEGKPKDIFSTPNKNIKVMIDNYGPKSSS